MTLDIEFFFQNLQSLRNRKFVFQTCFQPKIWSEKNEEPRLEFFRSIWEKEKVEKKYKKDLSVRDQPILTAVCRNQFLVLVWDLLYF